jgi:hypothetical protein
VAGGCRGYVVGGCRGYVVGGCRGYVVLDVAKLKLTQPSLVELELWLSLAIISYDVWILAVITLCVMHG